MPSSRPQAIPTVIHLVRQLRPQSILDVGVGFGKWGHLFREYTDILAAEREPGRYHRPNWKVRIDGIEGHAAYITELHRFLYNEIYVGDACDLLRTLSQYDIVFMGDIIEHLEKDRGQQLLKDALARANKAVILSTPKDDTGQQDLCGNELERHRSLWSAKDFHAYEGVQVHVVDRATLLVAMTKPGYGPLTWKSSSRETVNLQRLEESREQICELIPPTARFILVDEEQIRSHLPHRHVVPFLEKGGQYWGPPADDSTAILELQRLRTTGVEYLVFIWTTFWWLDYFVQFEKFVRSSFPVIHEDNRTVVFRLQDSG